MRSRRCLAVLAAALLLPSCAPKTTIQKAGSDQEIATEILWEYRKDPRFAEIRVSCVEKLITLEGRVPDQAALDTALAIARTHARSSTVTHKLEIRPR